MLFTAIYLPTERKEKSFGIDLCMRFDLEGGTTAQKCPVF